MYIKEKSIIAFPFQPLCHFAIYLIYTYTVKYKIHYYIFALAVNYNLK